MKLLKITVGNINQTIPETNYFHYHVTSCTTPTSSCIYNHPLSCTWQFFSNTCIPNVFANVVASNTAIYHKLQQHHSPDHSYRNRFGTQTIVPHGRTMWLIFMTSFSLSQIANLANFNPLNIIHSCLEPIHHI